MEEDIDSFNTDLLPTSGVRTSMSYVTIFYTNKQIYLLMKNTYLSTSSRVFNTLQKPVRYVALVSYINWVALRLPSVFYL